MHKALNIKKISAAPVGAAEICRILDEANVEFVSVDNHCWAADYPYKPKFEVRMAHNGKQLLINYRVTEECVRAVAPHDDGNVWEDSCCELFLSPVADGTYYNMECNAAGTLLMHWLVIIPASSSRPFTIPARKCATDSTLPILPVNMKKPINVSSSA